MPFGTCNTPATFQRPMDKVFTAGINGFILAYINDILVFINSLEERWDHLMATLQPGDAELFGKI